MKSIIVSLMATAGLAASGAALAVDLPPAGQKNCAACHAVGQRVVGPAFMDVSRKYKGKKNAVATITKHIKSGGSFGWNYGVMPPRGLGANDAEVATMAKFIVGLAKK
ncbi:MAG TPA: c-type cytochrome [Gallionellaceae bacterium]|nr:c-type cytochrome [Gallionellaceae bacterium]